MTPSPLLGTGSLAEEDVVARLRTGDAEAITEAYYRYAAGLMRLATGLLSSADDAEDVVQDLFVGLPEALLRYEGRGRLDAWLRRVTVRLCLMRLRSGRRRVRAAMREVEEATHSSSNQSWDGAGLQAALARLPDKLRMVVVLKLFEGYSHLETAELLGISRATSEVRLYRAVRQLRLLLEDK